MISAMKNIAFVNYAELICCSPHPHSRHRHRRRRCLAGVIMTMIVVPLIGVSWGLLCDARHLHLC